MVAHLNYTDTQKIKWRKVLVLNSGLRPNFGLKILQKRCPSYLDDPGNI